MASMINDVHFVEISNPFDDREKDDALRSEQK